MVAFERYLNNSRDADWASNYIDYAGLKSVLAESVSRRKLANTLRKRGLMPTSASSQDFAADTSLGGSALGLSTTSAGDDIFSKALDREVEKVVIFFLKVQGEIANKLLHLRLRMRAIGPLAAGRQPVEEETAADGRGSLRRLSSADPTTAGAISEPAPAAESGMVVPFKVPPMATRPRRMSATPQDLTEEYRDICNQLVKLLRFIELNSEAVRKILKKHDRVLLADDLMTGSYLTTRASRSPASHLRQLFHHNGISAIVSSLKTSLEEMPENCRSLQESFVIRVQDREAIQEMMAGLDKVQRTRARVHEKTDPFVSFLSLKPLIFDQEELEVGVDIHELLHLPHGLSVWLNVLHVFLSTVNTYITVPTTNDYAESLGVNPAYSGVIIGMSPLAQIFSSFLFSYWSNYAFRRPLLLSCTLQLLGNIFYGAALGYHSLPMLLIGRFIGGAGTAEAVNRRYIADVIPPRERTAASVAFVTASAVGMSAGPALAAALFPVNFQVGRFPINDATAPAWLMVLLWAAMIATMLFCFKEPTHRYHNHRRDAHKRHRRGQHQQHQQHQQPHAPDQQEDTGGPDEETAALKPRRPSQQGQAPRREGYGAVLHLKEAAAAEEGEAAAGGGGGGGGGGVGSGSGGTDTPPRPPHFMSPSSTVGSQYSGVGANSYSSIGTPASATPKLRQHRLAKIHPILLLVWRNKPLMITLAVYALIEIADEIILSSAGLIATHYFDWSISQVGGFLALLGLLVLPANLLVGESSGHGYEDRTIIVTSQAVTILGLLLIISYWGEYTEFQFVVGTSVIFVSVAIMEGVDTSLMSKVIPPVLSRGTFNSGLLAVQIGMVAKAVGDGMITFIGLRADDLINGLYIPILVITIGLMLICIRYFNAMG